MIGDARLKLETLGERGVADAWPASQAATWVPAAQTTCAVLPGWEILKK